MVGTSGIWVVVLGVTFGISSISSMMNDPKKSNIPATINFDANENYFDGPDVEFSEPINEAAMLEELKEDCDIKLNGAR